MDRRSRELMEEDVRKVIEDGEPDLIEVEDDLDLGDLEELLSGGPEDMKILLKKFFEE